MGGFYFEHTANEVETKYKARKLLSRLFWIACGGAEPLRLWEMPASRCRLQPTNEKETSEFANLTFPSTEKRRDDGGRAPHRLQERGLYRSEFAAGWNFRHALPARRPGLSGRRPLFGALVSVPAYPNTCDIGERPPPEGVITTPFPGLRRGIWRIMTWVYNVSLSHKLYEATPNHCHRR